VISARIFNHNGELDDEIVTVLGLTQDEKLKLSAVLKTAKLNLEQLVKSKTIIKEKTTNSVVLDVQSYRTEEKQIKEILKSQVEVILGRERASILYDIGERSPSFFLKVIDPFQSHDVIQKITITVTNLNYVVTGRIAIKSEGGYEDMEPSANPSESVIYKQTQLFKIFKDSFPEAMK
jgi:hypothetical protein